MARLIDADALHKQIFADNCGDLSKKENVAQILLRIEKAPTIAVDAQPVKCGRWHYDNAKDQCFCTECGNYTYIGKFENEILSNYCPHCGTKMEG